MRILGKGVVVYFLQKLFEGKTCTFQCVFSSSKTSTKVLKCSIKTMIRNTDVRKDRDIDKELRVLNSPNAKTCKSLDRRTLGLKIVQSCSFYKDSSSLL